MPTGRVSDIVRLLPPGIKVKVKQLAVTAWSGFGSNMRTTGVNAWRVSIITPDVTLCYEDYRFSDAVKGAIKGICCEGWADVLWQEYAAKNPKSGVVMLTDVMGKMTAKTLATEIAEQSGDVLQDCQIVERVGTLKHSHKPEQVNADQECRNCGAVVDPIYITCPSCGSYSLYEVQVEQL